MDFVESGNHGGNGSWVGLPGRTARTPNGYRNSSWATDHELVALLAAQEEPKSLNGPHAYVRLLGAWTQLAPSATDDDGAWKFPNGAAFSDNALADMTSTALTAAEIHDIGLREVARIHEEMRTIQSSGIPRRGFAGRGGTVGCAGGECAHWVETKKR